MVAPLLIGAAGVAAAGAIVNFLNSEQARNASAKERRQLQQMLDAIQGPTYKEGEIAAPEFDMSTLTPEDYAIVQKYVPEAAPYVAEQAPQTIGETEAMGMGRQAELAALQRLSGIAGAQRDPQLMQAMAQAAQQSQTEAQSRQASVMQDASRRGQLGSGISLALAQQGGMGAMQQGAQASQEAASQAYANRLRALSQSAQLGGQIRGEDVSLQGRNADIINQFNARTARASQDWATQRANLANTGQRYNIEAAQDVANRNVGQRNLAQTAARTRADEIARYRGEWGRGERDYYNKLQSDTYQNALDRLRVQGGITSMAREDIGDRAKDYGQGISGITQAGMGYMQAQEAADASERGSQREDERTFFKEYGRWPTGEEMGSRRKTYSYGEDE